MSENNNNEGQQESSTSKLSNASLETPPRLSNPEFSTITIDQLMRSKLVGGNSIIRSSDTPKKASNLSKPSKLGKSRLTPLNSSKTITSSKLEKLSDGSMSGKIFIQRATIVNKSKSLEDISATKLYTIRQGRNKKKIIRSALL